MRLWTKTYFVLPFFRNWAESHLSYIWVKSDALQYFPKKIQDHVSSLLPSLKKCDLSYRIHDQEVDDKNQVGNIFNGENKLWSYTSICIYLRVFGVSRYRSKAAVIYPKLATFEILDTINFWNGATLVVAPTKKQCYDTVNEKIFRVTSF